MKNTYLLLIAFTFSGLQSWGQKIDKQGHRGARGIMPENTIAGMLKALDLGVNTLQMNVVITKDKQVVLSHTPYFNNETSLTPQGKSISLKEEKKFNIYKMDYDQVKKFDVGSKMHPRFPGQQKFIAHEPLLEDLIDSVDAYVKLNRLKKPQFNIEIKTIPNGSNEFHPEAAEFVDLIMDVIITKKLEKRVTLSCFEVEPLQHLHQEYPKVKTGLMIDEKEDFEKNIEELGFNPTIYSPYSILVGKGLVDRCHEAGIKIVPWTINTVKEMKYLINLGVDGIITDYPNLFDLLEN